MHSSSDIPDKEPTSFICGDTVKWNKDLASHFPADAWTLTYYFRGPTSYDVTATADGKKFSVTIPSTDTGASEEPTAKFKVGRYQLLGRVSKISEPTTIYSVYSGFVDACADPVAIAAPAEMRSEAKQILDALIALMKRHAGRPEKSYSLSAVGRSFVFHSFAEIKEAIDEWSEVVAMEENSGKQRNVFIKFTKPT